MPAPTAPGADWAKARQDWESRAKTSKEIADDFGLSVHAVNKRANREGWQRDRTNRVPISTVWLAKVDDLDIADEPTLRRTRAAAAILADAVARGLPDVLAAPLAGMSRETFNQWRDADPKLRLLLEEAQSTFAAARVQNLTDASDRGDAQSARWMLERHAATREHFRASDSGAGGIQISVTFAAPVAGNALGQPTTPVIDVVADDLDEGGQMQIPAPRK